MKRNNEVSIIHIRELFHSAAGTGSLQTRRRVGGLGGGGGWKGEDVTCYKLRKMEQNSWISVHGSAA